MFGFGYAMNYIFKYYLEKKLTFTCKKNVIHLSKHGKPRDRMMVATG